MIRNRYLGLGVILSLPLFLSSAWGQTLTTVLQNGSPSNRIDLIFIGDGYTNSQIDTLYPSHVQNQLDYLFSGAFRNPFPRYKNFFNAHQVSVVSNESGADQPPNNIFRDTALDAQYWWGGTERCLYFNTSKANQAVGIALAGTGIDIDARFGLVNDTKYGGCGGQWAVFAAANSSAFDIGVHELGHSLGGLADEYFSPGTYTGPEPFEVNVTKSPATGKWDRWLGYNDPDTNIGPIGYFEGARYFQNGIYRPSNNSEMRSLFRPFDAVSREQFIRRFYEEVDPLDDWLPNSSLLVDPTELWVDSIDSNVIGVEWFVDGNSLGVLGESVQLDEFSLTSGTYSITARAYDTILDHSFSGNSLDWWRYEDTSLLEQSITWTVQWTSSLLGDFDFNGAYQCADIDMLVSEVATQGGNLQFDLNDDGSVDTGDVDSWLAIAGAANLASGQAYLVGDANLDGSVDLGDFDVWNANRFQVVSAWCAGDFNADGVVDISDFHRWNAHKFTSSGLVGVPEPESMWPLMLAVTCGWMKCRRRRKP